MPDGPGALVPPSESPTDYQFDIDEFFKDNLGRVTAIMIAKGRGQYWDFYDPEDLANQALEELEKNVREHPGIRGKKESIEKMLSTIAERIWIDEVRRETQEGSVSGSGYVRVSWTDEMIAQLADRIFERKVTLQEELDDIKPALTGRQIHVAIMLLEERRLSEISLNLGVYQSTIDKEIATIKKKVKARRHARATSNEQRATSNEQRGCNPP